MEQKSRELSPASGRIYYLDVLRALACMAVVLIHSTALFATQNIGTVDFWIGHIPNAFVRVGVPLFIMLSGALMLDENYVFSVKKQVRHILSIMLFFVFWSIVYSGIINVLLPLYRGEPLQISEIIKTAFLGPYHFWYCFVIVGLYLLVPLLRLWVKRENKRQIEYFMLLALVVSFFLPIFVKTVSRFIGAAGLLSEPLENLHLEYVGGYTAYFILGWYLRNFDIRRKKLVYLLGFFGLLVTIFGSFFLSQTLGEKYLLNDNLSAHIFVQAAAVFLWIKSVYSERIPAQNSHKAKFVHVVASCSLGIYAMHDIVLKLLQAFLEHWAPFTRAWVQIPIAFFTSFFLSLVVSLLLKKLPFFKKVV